MQELNALFTTRAIALERGRRALEAAERRAAARAIVNSIWRIAA